MIVTQRALGEETSQISRHAPRTWEYLVAHQEFLDSRRSSIYRNRPRFSMFGIGPYTFAPWKVAISGLYKRLEFVAVGPIESRPRVLDDTAYFLPCESECEANLLCELMNSVPAREFLSSLIFWDSKRPITTAILARLDVLALAEECGDSPDLQRLSPTARRTTKQPQQFFTFDSVT